MHPRSMTFAALACGAFVFPVMGGSAPVTLKYRIAQTVEQTVDASAMGQGEEKVRGGFAAFLTVTLNDSADGRSLRAVVDSVVPDPESNPIMLAALVSVDGATGTGFVDSSGKLASFTEAVADSGAAGQTGRLENLVESLFPRMKASAAPGDVWTDTTETSDTTNGTPVSRRAVMQYTVSEGADSAGAKTTKFDISGSYSMAGAGADGIAFEGTGTQSGTFQRRGGHLVAADLSDNANMLVIHPQAPEPIPIANVSSITITLLK